MKPISSESTGLYFWQHEFLTGTVQCSNQQSELTPHWSDTYRAWIDRDVEETTDEQVSAWQQLVRDTVPAPLVNNVKETRILPEPEPGQQLALAL